MNISYNPNNWNSFSLLFICYFSSLLNNNLSEEDRGELLALHRQLSELNEINIRQINEREQELFEKTAWEREIFESAKISKHSRYQSPKAHEVPKRTFWQRLYDSLCCCCIKIDEDVVDDAMADSVHSKANKPLPVIITKAKYEPLVYVQKIVII